MNVSKKYCKKEVPLVSTAPDEAHPLWSPDKSDLWVSLDVLLQLTLKCHGMLAAVGVFFLNSVTLQIFINM